MVSLSRWEKLIANRTLRTVCSVTLGPAGAMVSALAMTSLVIIPARQATLGWKKMRGCGGGRLAPKTLSARCGQRAPPQSGLNGRPVFAEQHDDIAPSLLGSHGEVDELAVLELALDHGLAGQVEFEGDI